MSSARGRGRGRSRGRGRGRGRGKGGDATSVETRITEESSSSDTSSCSTDDCPCALCGLTTKGDWIACDQCEKWFHQECVTVSSPLEDNWFCDNCVN